MIRRAGYLIAAYRLHFKAAGLFAAATKKMKLGKQREFRRLINESASARNESERMFKLAKGN